MRLFTSLLFFVLLSGCSAPKKVHAPKTAFKVPARCRLIAATRTKHVIMVIRRHCLVNGLTTVMFVVTDTSNGGKKATEEGTRMLISKLRFVPRMSLLVAGKIPMKGRQEGVMYLFAVLGAEELL